MSGGGPADDLTDCETMKLSLPRACLAVALFVPACQSDPKPLTQGVVKLLFQRAENQGGSPYPGTQRVIATLSYQPCLIDYYERNPSQKADGRDGEAVFGSAELGGEGWTDRLCDTDVPGGVDCEVESIEQQINVATNNQLTVTYTLTEDLEYGVLPFGPLPTEETAACPDDLPYARVKAVDGYNGAGGRLWRTQNFNPDRAYTNQGEEISIYAVAAM